VRRLLTILVAFGLAVGTAVSAAAVPERAHELTLPGEFYSRYHPVPAWINNNGQVAAIIHHDNGDEDHGAFWGFKLKPRPIPGLDGTTYSSPMDMNERGQVIGRSFPADDEHYPRMHGFLWQRGRAPIDLGHVFPFAINGVGQIVANRYVPDDSPSGFDHQPVLIDGDRITVIPRLPDTDFYRGVDINDRGQVIGTAAKRGPDGWTWFGWRWNGGRRLRVLSTDAGSVGSDVAAINEAGQVAGTIVGIRGRSTAVRWHRGQVTRLGRLKGHTDSEAVDINERGTVLLMSHLRPVPDGRTDVTRSALWSNGTRRGLGILIRGGSTRAADLSNRGHVTGSATFRRDGLSHAFFWTRRSGIVDLNADVLPVLGRYGRGVAVNDHGVVAGVVGRRRGHVSNEATWAVVWK
jgi:uncharacterized membrane protein